MRTWLVALIGALFLIAGMSPVLAEESASLSMVPTDAHFDGSGGVESSGTFDRAAISRLVEDEYNVTPLGVVNDLYSYRCVIGDRVLFMAIGMETLWLTDGTVDGTYPVYEFDGYSHLGCAVLDGQAYFVVSKTTAFLPGTELWATDGTTEGTRLVRDFGPDARIAWKPFASPNWLFLVVSSPAEGVALWVSDGTGAGTRSVKMLAAASEHTPVLRVGFGDFGDDVLFEVGGEFWISDGTDAGSRLFADLAPDHELANPDNWTRFGDRILFNTDEGFWVSDGTETGTTLLHDTLRMSKAYAQSGAHVDGRWLFAGWTEETGSGLWVTDGTPPGTALVHDLEPDSAIRIDYRTRFGQFGGRAVVTWSSDTSTEVWISDGTAAGTRLVERIEAVGLIDFAVVGDRFVLGFSRPVTFAEVWVSDGTTKGTHRIPDLWPGSKPRAFGAQYPDSAMFDFTRFGDRLLFGGYDRTTALGGLWVTDGTVEGTGLVARIGGLANLEPIGDNVIFIANARSERPDEFHVISWDPEAIGGEVEPEVDVGGTFINLTEGGNDESADPSVSADGSTVVFISAASNLTPGDTNGQLDVLVWDRSTGTVANLTESGNGSSSSPSVSADGSTVVFSSAASNLTPNDNNGNRDVFLWDRSTGTVANLTESGNGSSSSPSVSADGSTVVFSSAASNLTPGDTNGQLDVFVWDRATGALTNITQDGNSSSGYPYTSVSADGSVVAFSSYARNLTPNDTNANEDVFLWDRATGALTNITQDGNRSSVHPSVSADGTAVAFTSHAWNLTPNNPNGWPDVLTWDRASSTLSNITKEGNCGSGSPAVSAHGSIVAFVSCASNLTPDDTNGNTDVFVWDAEEPVISVSDFNDAPNLESLVNATNYSNTLDAPILRLYRAYFNRDPDLGGAKYWLTIRRDGYGLLEIAGFMAGGQEFANNYSEVNDAEYLRRVYQNMLGRLYDQAGFNYWLDLLRGTNQHGLNPNHDQLSRSGVVFYITGGTEFINNYPYTK